MATTTVYASIVRSVGGDKVSVSAVLADPSADPHSFEASPKVALEISKANILVANGGGYDDFAGQLRDAAEVKPVLIDAVQVSGLDSAAEGFNEHVFFDLDAMTLLANEIARQLGILDPASAAEFAGRAQKFGAELARLKTEAATIGGETPGLQAILTEPVAGYLLEDAGFVDVTPPGFAKAVEAETDPSVKDTAATDDLLTGGSVDVLVVNSQTSGPVADGVVAVATTAGVPTVAVGETLPEGIADYPSWIEGTIAALEDAVSKK